MTENVWDESVQVAGPADPESFHEQQKRHRRRSGWFTLWSAFAIALMGIPLAAVVSPLLYALAIVVLDLVNLVVPTPDLLAFVAEDSSGDVPPEMWPVIGAALVLPGSVLMLLAWIGVRRLFARVGSGTAVLAMGAREIGDSLEERQFRNVVEEMAVAAGVPAPRVLMFDSEIPNAAAVGSRIDDATVVATTGLLASLGRAETQAVVGHLVGSVGNGDLRIGTTLASVFQTLGLVESVLRSPGERGPRKTLRRLVRYAFRRPGADDTAAVAHALLHAGTTTEIDPDEKTPSGLMSVLLLPFVMAGLAFSMTRLIFGFVLVNPVLRRAWRARKHLADATAVQLTREPGSLARALDTVTKKDPVVPGTEALAYLFFAGREVNDGKGPDTVTFGAPSDPRLARLRAMGADLTRNAPAYSRRQRVVLVGVLTLTAPIWLSFFALFLMCALMLTAVSLMIDMLFLAPMLALVHVLLR